MKAAILTDRAVLRVSGPEARHFLHNLVTSSVETLTPGEARYAALLAPQGKIIADFMVLSREDGFLLDLPAHRASELKKRLTLYRLRAKVVLEEEAMRIVAIWDCPAPPALPNPFADPRLHGLGFRAIVPADQLDDALSGLEVLPEEAYHAHRIALGVPEGGRDFGFDDAFPHEADMDQLGGVDFRKGCYIGQEVVSRMQHRATARTRVVPVRLDGTAVPGTEITAGERPLGTLGSVADGKGLALIRLDRADEALGAGQPIRAGDAVVILEKPDWARFRFPGDPPPHEAAP